jgi:hypothetical protein
MEDLTLSDIILDPDGNITYYWLVSIYPSVNVHKLCYILDPDGNITYYWLVGIYPSVNVHKLPMNRRIQTEAALCSYL